MATSECTSQPHHDVCCSGMIALSHWQWLTAMPVMLLLNLNVRRAHGPRLLYFDML